MQHEHDLDLATLPAASTSRVGRSEADRQLRSIARERCGHDAEEARWLLVARREGLHRQYGYATIFEYMERVLGYGPHAARERLRVAEALEWLPKLATELAEGRLCWSAVRELTRIAGTRNEIELIAAAQGRTVGEIETMLRGLPVGGVPGDEPDPDSLHHRLRFEVTSSTFAMFREARRQLELDTGESLDDGAVLEAMCRAVLGGPADEGRASYQVALTVCDRCDRAWQDGAGRAVEVPETVLERAMCDAQEIGRVDSDEPERAVQSVPPAVRRFVLRRDHGRCVVPGCRSSRYLDVHHVRFRSDLGSNEPHNLLTVCGAHHDALHEGRLIIEGRAPDALLFLRPGGEPYASQQPLAPAAATNKVADDVRGALRRMGFKEVQARTAVEKAWSHVGPHSPVEALLREALRAIPARVR